MRDDRIELVRVYLTREFCGATIEHKHDFDRDTETFKVSFKGDTALLKVGGEFLDDNGEEEILRLFNLWALSAILAKEKTLGVLVTQAGLSTFER
jgi:hypothetical protein